ncbi:MAG: 4-carboxy-4-hydroxy-2-oxoadipate aldolase/oxaloacetate decarboxylase [Symbiopectobacterium sp.]|uniref:4-carboxy-4-hydroxy-2-oxoadipate aldolase/oxaloacetate decarboxylase n=1 Tax=Symbiopectobacterium sp. TaxID=2952789 RepID=UPI0039EBD2DB
MSKLTQDFIRPDQELIDAFKEITAATVHEAFGRRGAVDSAIKPIYPGLRVLGSAFTVKTPAGDNFTIHAALQLAKPGDVLVIDAGDYTEQGSFGDVMATAALSRGIAGLVTVTNGGVRDAERIHKLGFPIFSRSISIKGTVKETFGEINQPISFGGVTINPGDLIIGDDDGIVAIPREKIEEVLAASRSRDEKEVKLRAQIQQGKTIWELHNVNALLKRNGINVEI